MRISEKLLLAFLRERQTLAGGFTGEDLATFAREHGVHPYPLRRRVLRLIAHEASLAGLRNLGERAPTLALEDVALFRPT